MNVRYSPAKQAVVEFLINNYPDITDFKAAKPILDGYYNNWINKELKEYRESSLIASASFV
ncbi:MAG: hypothetical protein AABX66_02055 [Nanoarchaeota archaeon]